VLMLFCPIILWGYKVVTGSHGQSQSWNKC
jgi:hypothetical protein